MDVHLWVPADDDSGDYNGDHDALDKRCTAVNGDECVVLLDEESTKETVVPTSSVTWDHSAYALQDDPFDEKYSAFVQVALSAWSDRLLESLPTVPPAALAQVSPNEHPRTSTNPSPYAAIPF